MVARQQYSGTKYWLLGNSVVCPVLVARQHVVCPVLVARQQCSGANYWSCDIPDWLLDMEFLDVLTEGLERVLMVRGGGREVITLYS